MPSVAETPVVHTPTGGYGPTMPPPVLDGCDDPLVDGAPDLRGHWDVVEAFDDEGTPLPDDHPIRRHHERIEQAADRVIVTAGGVVHDMRADGVLEHGVHDVIQLDFTTPVDVTASFEDGVLVLRPEGFPGVEIRRWLEGDELVWRYHSAFTARMVRRA